MFYYKSVIAQDYGYDLRTFTRLAIDLGLTKEMPKLLERKKAFGDRDIKVIAKYFGPMPTNKKAS